jgi:hypothetical protein
MTRISVLFAAVCQDQHRVQHGSGLTWAESSHHAGGGILLALWAFGALISHDAVGLDIVKIHDTLSRKRAYTH